MGTKVLPNSLKQNSVNDISLKPVINTETVNLEDLLNRLLHA
jgi:hypothetical protein